LKIANLT